MDAALEIKNLTKYYGAYKAIDQLNLRIEQGEIFGLLGPNGAGKSTTINSICGLGSFQEGEISVYGHSVKKDPVSAKKLIGLSPQEYNMDNFLAVKKSLLYFGGYHGIPMKERKLRIESLLRQFNLTEHAHKLFKELSGGMKRRAILARALMNDPKLLILDEPTAALDVALRYELWDQIKELNKAGKTIILTSHYIEEIERLCERVAIINKGKLLFIGHKTELLKDHANLETAFMHSLRTYEN